MKELIRIARAELGVREQGGNNKGPRVQEYQRASWMSEEDVQKGFSWCAAFCCWVLMQWLKTAEGIAYMGRHKPASWRCRDASAFGFEKWGRSKNLEVLPKTALARAGDLVIFDFSHIGFVVEDQTSLRHELVTVEGNTNAEGARDSKSGDGVWLKKRAPKLVKCYVRLGVRAP